MDIEWKKCDNCGFLQHSSHIRCIHCKNQSFSTIKAAGECTLLTFTKLNAPPTEFRDKSSYVLGVMEFENGIKVLGQIVSNEEISLGMKMKSHYEKICDNLDGKEVYDLVFEPL